MNIAFWLQVLVALISIRMLIVTKSYVFLWLSLLFVIIAFVEGIGKYVANSSPELTILLMHVYTFFEFNFIFLIYREIVQAPRLRQFMKILILALNLLYFFSWFNSDYRGIVVPIGGIVVSVFMFLYFRALLLSDRVLYYRKHAMFWITIGFFVYYLASVPFFLMLDFMKDRGMFYVLAILVIVMNLFILYGLLCCQKREIY